ncbi:tetratricopeptide (TPR) repeat protein [Actinoplanes octamycinicus]|uniref:Tetratricopeptide (TPR) repeat protein n=1 Tax=Actinoplanes octamycinicus TaxID=135948 RepID=A0A7W7H143_9ACTN|nr:FxSxx-COOH system tetratricopeptide repeat protein [Actinoplanes octamycinicus]MBB4741983.1 tetratricopeptide (TPR) repeat protein [Actinoplanes octamycinicus]GIE60746.1 hypothetical protein Aoc01nite_61480 [Actinoplanes octamycinicus]
MVRNTGPLDPFAEFRASLIAALVEIPFMGSLADRRLLLQLVRRGTRDLPDIAENQDPRLHVVTILLTCMERPERLWALRAALLTMAPEAPGTKRVNRLIESASLAQLLPTSRLARARDALASATLEIDADSWRPGFIQSHPAIDLPDLGLVAAFDHLTLLTGKEDARPPALLLIDHVTALVQGVRAEELRVWSDETSDLLGLPAGQRPTDERTREDDEVAETVNPDLREAPDPISASSPDSSADGDIADVMPPVGLSEPLRRLPQVWGDVPPRNPNFTGREDLLDLLHRQLMSVREAAVLPQAVHGMGGVGKTQVAIEYVHRHSSEYDLIWWIPAEQHSQLLSSLTGLAQRLRLDVSPEASSAVPAVREALSTGQTGHAAWLLVFDNAESLQNVRQFFPTGGAGKILVTSRNPEWAWHARALEVDVFTRQESIQFLVNRVPGLTEQDADRLAYALGDLPLAVEQAAAWQAATGMPVEEYLRLLDDKRIELLEDAASPDYPVSVAAAWNVSLDALERVNPAAFQLLQVCSFLSAEPIPREFFAGPPASPIADPLDDTLRDSFKLSRALRDIQRYALAKLNHRNNTLQIHRLVQAVLISRMDEKQRALMRAGAQTLLAGANPHTPARRSRWDRYQALVPHVTTAGAVESQDPNVQLLVHETTEFLYHWGDHRGCHEFAEQAYLIWRDSLGESDPQTLRMMKFLGLVCFALGRYEQAGTLVEGALRLCSAAWGDEDEGTLDAMLLMAVSHRTRGEFASAKGVNERVLEICRRTLGEQDPVTLRAAAHLGSSLRLTGEFAAAADLDRATYQQQSEVLGGDDPDTLLTLSHYATDIREAGDFLQARAQQEEVLERTLAAYGPRHPPAMRASRNLAVARRKAGDHDGALRLATETAERFRTQYGESHPDTMAATLTLAVDLRHAGRLDESFKLGQATLDRYRAILGPDHPHTLAAEVNLAVVKRLRGDVEAANRADSQVIELLRDKLGPDHPTTLCCATNLASDRFSLGLGQEAFELDTDTLARSERVLGVEHPATLAVGVNLALDLRLLDRIQEGDRILADTLQRLRTVLGDRHPATLNALQSLRADCDLDPMPL